MTALLPAVGIGVALVAGGALGVGAGAGAGHITGGMSKSDLNDLADALDNGTSGLLVVAGTDLRGQRRRIDHPHEPPGPRQELNADLETLNQELARAVV